MGLVKFQDLSAYQQHVVREIYSDWADGKHADFAFWIRKDGQLANRRSGRHSMTDEAAMCKMRELAGGDVRSAAECVDGCAEFGGSNLFLLRHSYCRHFFYIFC